MDELGIQLIVALSPQVKGRVERAAGTFQDRLVSELRLAGAITIDDANRVLEGFLPRFNGRFKVPARESEVAYRAVDEGVCLERVLCFKYRRRVARDNTVRYRWRTLQLLPGTGRVRKTVGPRRRKPTPLQTARWKAVQKAKRKGLSMREIARGLGIHRDTVKKYMSAESPPVAPSRLTLNGP